MKNDIKYILISEEEIDSIVSRIAAEIDRDYPDRSRGLLLLCILKGSVVFMGDLMKKIERPVEIDFMKVSSYGSGTASSGKINIMLDLHRADMANLDVIVIEDIIDSGRTLAYLVDYLKLTGARSVKTCTMLDKPDRRHEDCRDFKPDYFGRVIPDEFVVGYGLDYAEQYRALPVVGILKPEVYTKG